MCLCLVWIFNYIVKIIIVVNIDANCSDWLFVGMCVTRS